MHKAKKVKLSKAKTRKIKAADSKHLFVLFMDINAKKRTANVCLARKGRCIKLNEAEARFLADALKHQVVEWDAGQRICREVIG